MSERIKNRHAHICLLQGRIRRIERQRECMTVKENEEESAASICMNIKRPNRKKTHNNNTLSVSSVWSDCICLGACVCSVARMCVCVGLCNFMMISVRAPVYAYRCDCVRNQASQPASYCSVALTTSCTLQWDLLCAVHVWVCVFFFLNVSKLNWASWINVFFIIALLLLLLSSWSLYFSCSSFFASLFNSLSAIQCII